MKTKQWKFEKGYWVGPYWPLTVLYWTPAVLMSSIASALLLFLVALVVAWWV